MFGLIVGAMALTIPASGAGLSAKIERGVSDKLLDGGLAGMWYEAFVAPDGTIEGCEVRAVIGDRGAAQKVCETVVGRTATPAVGPDGKAIYGSFVDVLNFADNFDRLPPAALAPDMIIQARGLPGGKDARVGVTATVGTDGKVLACEPGTGLAALSRAACEQVMSTALRVRTSKAGAAVSYLQPLIVVFELDRG